VYGAPTLDSGPETLDWTSLFWTSVPRGSRGKFCHKAQLCAGTIAVFDGSVHWRELRQYAAQKWVSSVLAQSSALQMHQG